MQIPILTGVYADANANLRASYPRNLIPVISSNGISNGYLRPAEGLVLFANGVGDDRGGIVWNGICYRVQGTDFVRVNENGTIDIIGSVGGSGQATLVYSFTHLAIASNNNLFLYDGSALLQVTDPDLGDVIDVAWQGGYFISTDGENIVSTELNDPFSIKTLNYASSEFDPDPVVSVLHLDKEIYAVNTKTIEVFANVGGAGFPFQIIQGAQISKGAVGTHAATVAGAKIAFVGGGQSDSVGIYFALNGSTEKISTREIDLILQEYTAAELSGIVVEYRGYLNHEFLYVHLPDQTLVFDEDASRKSGELIWFVLTGGVLEKTQYPSRGFVNAYGKWLGGDPQGGRIGETTFEISSHFDEIIVWEFGTLIMYNEGRGAIVHDIELVSLTGGGVLGVESTITTQYSEDGLSWSQPLTSSAGKRGERDQRVTWRRQGRFSNWRIQRFNGTSDAHNSMSRLEVRIEPLGF